MDEPQQPVAEAPVTQPATPVPTPPAPNPIPVPAPAPVPISPPIPPVSASSNTGMAILAYLGILIIVPFLSEAKNNPFVKFHIKQGLVLVIAWVGMSIISSVFYSIGSIAYLFSFIFSLIYLGLFIINLIGLVNAATGKQKELPIIGHFAQNFNF